MSFPIPAPVVLTGTDVNFQSGSAGDGDAGCTGTLPAPTAPAGKVCLYLSSASGTEIYTGEAAFGNRRGFVVELTSNGGNNDFVGVEGAWAYTAP